MIFTLKDKLLSKLALGQLVAPVMRDQKQRSFKVVDAAGKVVGHVTTAELQEAVAKRAGVELAIQQSVRRTFCALDACGKKLTAKQIAHLSKYCCHAHSAQARRMYGDEETKRAIATKQQARWRAAHREKDRAIAARWRAAHREKVRAQSARLTAKRKAKRAK